MHLVEGFYHKNRLSLKKFSSFPVPEGCMQKEAVTNPKLLSDAIQTAIQTAGFQAKQATLTMNASFATVRDVDLPLAKAKELGAMIKNEMVEAYHISPDDILEYREIDKIQGIGGETLSRYRVAAVDREIVEGFHQMMRQNKFKSVFMDINLNAIDKLFNSLVGINDTIIGEQAVMLIDYGHSGTTLFIASKDKPLFFRRLAIGSGEIERLVADALQLNISNIKDLKDGGFNFFDNSDTASSYYSALKPYFYRLIDEVRKIISFYNSRAGISAISHVYLYGNGGKLAGLGDYLSESVGLPISLINSIDKVSMPEGQVFDAAYLNAIGALIRY